MKHSVLFSSLLFVAPEKKVHVKLFLFICQCVSSDVYMQKKYMWCVYWVHVKHNYFYTFVHMITYNVRLKELRANLFEGSQPRIAILLAERS